ncbi:hypothetical protein [Azospirillum sp. sgz302134]
MTAVTYSMAHLPTAVAIGLVTVIPQCHARFSTVAAFLDVTASPRLGMPAHERGLVVKWSGFVHHSASIVAAAVGALTDPRLARTMTGEAWGMRLVPAIACIPKTDIGQRAVLAALGGVLLPWEGGPWAGDFAEALDGLIERRGLERFFDRSGPGHYGLAPRLDGLTREAKELSAVDRVILTTIVGLYRGDGWPEGFRRTWNPPAADAFGAVNVLWPTAPEDVRDFYRLLALYPGW